MRVSYGERLLALGSDVDDPMEGAKRRAWRDLQESLAGEVLRDWLQRRRDDANEKLLAANPSDAAEVGFLQSLCYVYDDVIRQVTPSTKKERDDG